MFDYFMKLSHKQDFQGMTKATKCGKPWQKLNFCTFLSYLVFLLQSMFKKNWFLTLMWILQFWDTGLPLALITFNLLNIHFNDKKKQSNALNVTFKKCSSSRCKNHVEMSNILQRTDQLIWMNGKQSYPSALLASRAKPNQTRK